MHGLVAIPIPPYFKQPMSLSQHRHHLALRQIHITEYYNKFAFFPSTVVYWNQLPAQIVLLPTLDQFSVEVRPHKLIITRQELLYPIFIFFVYVLLTLLSILFLKLSTLTEKRTQPARNPREGCCRIITHKNKSSMTTLFISKLWKTFSPHNILV